LNWDGKLVVGGEFTSAGGIAASKVALWDGTNWQALGTGLDDTVCALTVYRGELVAAGRFTAAGAVPANSVARWDGTSWLPLGAGVGGYVSGFGGLPYASALAAYRGELIVGGSFTTAGDQVSAYWARWGCAVPDVCLGDGNCDGVVNWRDIDYLVAAQNDNESAWTHLFPAWNPSCPLLNLDTSMDGHVNWRDIDPFIAQMNTTCP